jgi:hypothetical protein
MREIALFCCLFQKKRQRSRILPEEHRQKERAGDRACHGHYRQPVLPRGAVLMVSITLPGILCWGNPYSLLPDILGPSPSHGGELRSPFLSGRRLAGRMVHKRPRVRISSVFLRLILHDVPIKSRFLGRPRLLTRSVPLPTGRDISSVPHHTWIGDTGHRSRGSIVRAEENREDKSARFLIAGRKRRFGSFVRSIVCETSHNGRSRRRLAPLNPHTIGETVK